MTVTPNWTSCLLAFGAVTIGGACHAAPDDVGAFKRFPVHEEMATESVQTAGTITSEDYPREAIAKNQAGTTVVRYIVSRAGSVPVCIVTQSSGSELLDQHSCEIVKARFRFIPAKDKKGRSIATSRTQRITWNSPGSANSPLSDMKPVNVEIELIVSPDGTVKNCRVIKFESSFNETSDAACPWASGNKRFKPFPGNRDRRLIYHNSLSVSEVE